MTRKFIKLERPKPKPRPIRETNAKPNAAKDRSEQKISRFQFEQPVNEGWHPEERSHHREERRYWRLSNIATWLSVFLTFTAVGAAMYTVVLSIDSLNEARIATFEARRQADQAARQANIAADTERRQLRAYIYVDKGKIIVTGSGRITYEAKIKNAGLTPAYHIESVGDIVDAPFPFEVGLPVKFGDSPVTTRLFGDVQHTMTIGPGEFAVITSIVDRAQFRSIKARKNIAKIFYGAIYYDDAFGISHFYKYCFFVNGADPKFETNTCREGNEAN